MMKPDVINNYNQTMGGADLLSCVLIPYSTQRRGVKWYHKLAELFVDTSLYNAFIVWKKLNPEKVNTEHLQFRKLLIDELITWHSFGTRSHQRGLKTSTGGNPMRLAGKHYLTLRSSKQPQKVSSNQLCGVLYQAT